MLKREAEQKHIGRNRIAHQRGGEAAGCDQCHRLFPGGIGERMFERIGRQFPVRVFDKRRGWRQRAVDQHAGAPGPNARQHVCASRHHQVSPYHQISSGSADACRMQVFIARRDLHVARHLPALLRQTRHVEHLCAVALKMRRHGDDLADGDDAGAADAGDENVERLRDCRNLRRREIRQCGGVGAGLGACRHACRHAARRAHSAARRPAGQCRASPRLTRFFQRTAFNRDKARAKTIDA